MADDRQIAEVLAEGFKTLATAVDTTRGIARIEATLVSLVKGQETCISCQKQIWMDSQRIAALETQHTEQGAMNDGIWAQINKLSWLPVGMFATIAASVIAGVLIYLFSH